MAEKNDSYSSQVKQIGALTAIPILLLSGAFVGYFAGSWIDRKFQLYPWFTILLVALGFVASGREVTRLLKQVLKDDKEKN